MDGIPKTAVMTVGLQVLRLYCYCNVYISECCEYVGESYAMGVCIGSVPVF